eukprot:COSAG02_NODE_27660_length_605_cov_0.703557_1_plen_32_part_10
MGGDGRRVLGWRLDVMGNHIQILLEDTKDPFL